MLVSLSTFDIGCKEHTRIRARIISDNFLILNYRRKVEHVVVFLHATVVR